MMNNDKLTWIYFIQAPVKPYLVKIGQTQGSVKTRLSSLQVGSPIELNVVLKVRGHPALEYDFHTLFSEYRRHGEWFEPKGILASFIKDCRANNVTYFGPLAARSILVNFNTQAQAQMIACMISLIDQYHRLKADHIPWLKRLDVGIPATNMV